MPDYEDILDHTGRTPRELGSVHIHVEPVVRGPSGEAVAKVWLQSALEPLFPTDSLHVIARLADNRGELSLKRLPLPALDGGKVVCWSVPLSLPADLSELQFRVESKPHPKASRVRPVWKLLETLEIRKESEMRPATANIEFDLTGSIGDTLSSGGLSLSFNVATTPGSSLASDVAVKRHAPRELPPGFVASVIEGTPELLDAPRVEKMWEPGQPLPEVAPALVPTWGKEEQAPQPSRSALRICFSCGFEGPRAEYERARSCPSCDASWT
jgi:hypothetical protein